MQQAEGAASGGLFDLHEEAGWRDERRRFEAALQGLSASVLEACAPLMASKDRRAALMALDAAEAALMALHHIDAAGKEEKEGEARAKDVMKARARREGRAEAAGEEEEDEGATQGKVDQSQNLLPRVHFLWPYLVACLKSPDLTILVMALQLVATVAYAAGGSFVARRFQDDAWPLMWRLLSSGPPQQGAVAAGAPNPLLMAPEKPAGGIVLSRSENRLVREGEGEGGGRQLVRRRAPPGNALAAPASMLQLRTAVLGCIAAVAGTRTSARALAPPLVKHVAGVLVPFLGDAHPPALRASAGAALLALAKVEPDALWLLLSDLLYGQAAAPPPAVSGERAPLQPPPSSPLISVIAGVSSSESLPQAAGPPGPSAEPGGEGSAGGGVGRSWEALHPGRPGSEFAALEHLLPPWEEPAQALWAQWAKDKRLAGSVSVSAPLLMELLGQLDALQPH